MTDMTRNIGRAAQRNVTSLLMKSLPRREPTFLGLLPAFLWIQTVEKNTGIPLDFLQTRGAHFGKRLIRHTQTGIVLEFGTIANQEIPIEIIKGAGLSTRF